MARKVQNRTQYARDRARDYGQQLRDDMMRARQAARDDFESYVQDYPWRSVGIAAGVGAIVGASAAMMRRK